ncbi:MAG: reductive dehalogenase domain-containing protein, partial [Candidatus Methanofastidiosia archaeon]
MNFGIVKENKRPYEIREYKRFDEKYTIFSRWVWDKDIIGFKEMKERREVRNIKRKMRGYSLKDYALQHASWTVEDWLKGNTWYIESPYSVDFQKEHLNLSKFSNFRAENAKEMSKIIKRVAKFFGADLVGIAEIDKRWIYSHYYERRTGNYKHKAIKLPKEYKYGIVMAVEMDLESIKTSPSCIASSATGLGYSKMSFLAIMLAEFIRYLGYKAIPHGNDLSLSIPFAIDAGLGQLGRNGLLITKEYGPNVRISKVFTDLPL